MLSNAAAVLEAMPALDEFVSQAATSTPDGDLVGLLTALPTERLTGFAALDAAVALHRHVGLLQARQQQVLAALAQSSEFDAEFAQDLVACALHLPPAQAPGVLADAVTLVRDLPDTHAALADGVISLRHVTVLVRAVAGLDAAQAATVEARVLAGAGGQTVAQFRTAVQRAVLAVADAEQRHQTALERRRVVITPVEDGMAELWALLPADGAAAVKQAIEAVADETIHGHGGDDRTADQRRADALVLIADHVLADPRLTRNHGRRPGVQITVAATTLLGLDDQPAELAGFGPVPAAVARRLAADPTGTWRRLIVDPAGRLLPYRIRRYRPPAAIADHVATRDQHCTFPGCRRAAARCDLDHETAYRDGGPTDCANLSARCRRHHRSRHSGNWRVTRDQHSGDTAWTSGQRRYLSSPPPLPDPNNRGTDPDPPPS